jgi:hypothetical protein
VPGRAIILASWWSVVLFAVVALPDLLLDSFNTVATVTSATLFFLSLPVWVYAFAVAVARSARGDDIAVGSMFFLTGSAPPEVRRSLLGAVGAAIVVAAVTCVANPAGVLVPMLQLGLVGLWAARYGTFPARRMR